MDPRHPEVVLPRVKELIKQYERIEKDLKNATTSSSLGQLEREGGLVIQEICLVAPRLHENMMKVSRERRYDIANMIYTAPQSQQVAEIAVMPKTRKTKKRKKANK